MYKVSFFGGNLSAFIWILKCAGMSSRPLTPVEKKKDMPSVESNLQEEDAALPR